MTIDRNTIKLSIRRATVIPTSREATTACKVVKKFNETGKIFIDQARVENKQSELRLKGELATRIELDFPREAACRMRSFRG